MKKVLLMIMLVVTAVCFLAACNDKPSNTQNQDFIGIVFENQTIDYDGEEHTITATGVPEGVSAVYTNAGPYKNAGEYDISIAVSAEGYNTYTKSVKLVINKIDFPSTITFENKKVMYTGGEKNILISGELPEGTQIQYTNNKGTEVGEYNAVATLTNPNYNSKTLRAILTIYNVINAFMVVWAGDNILDFA